MNELNSIERKALELLIEFRELCYENNLKFFLGPRMTALADCFGGFGRVFRIPDICMPLEDALSFISLIAYTIFNIIQLTLMKKYLYEKKYL